MHKGTDFAARGTPIMASGSGVVEKTKVGSVHTENILELDITLHTNRLCSLK